MDAARLLHWFRRNARRLPWREEPRDPYRVWVSEAMLQQTRVETVLRYYGPFLARFPTLASLVEADEDALMKAWEGLGYYRRVRLLQKGARAVVERHGGRVPADADALLALPGMGPYTAGAVGSLAHGLPLPAVDGNVLRVWSRLEADAEDVGQPSARRKAEAWVRAHQPPASPGAFNEALMELGATVCTPRQPRCGACPLRETCRAHALGRVDEFPVKAAKAAQVEVRVAMAVARRGRALLLEKREDGLLAGTWGLPWVEVPAGVDPADALVARVAALTGAPARVLPEPVARASHLFTHRRWAMEAYAVEAEGVGGEWREPATVALSTAHRRVLDQLG